MGDMAEVGRLVVLFTLAPKGSGTKIQIQTFVMIKIKIQGRDLAINTGGRPRASCLVSRLKA